MPILWQDDETDKPLPDLPTFPVTYPTFATRIDLFVTSPYAAPIVILTILAAVILLVTVRAADHSPGGVGAPPPVASDPATPSTLLRDPDALRGMEVWAAGVDLPEPGDLPVPHPWDQIADCESGQWDRHGNPIPHTRDWAYDDGQFQGGLNFHPDTWDWLRPPHYPDNAADATPWQQIMVAERVRDTQGMGAWPVCSTKVN